MYKRQVFALAALPAIAGLFTLRQVRDAPPAPRDRAAAVNLVYALLAVPLGALSDRIGRRRLLIVGWAVYAAVYAGFAAATSAWQLWTLFAAYGVYYASAEGTVKAWVGDLVPVQRRGAAYGLYAAAAGLLVLPASVIAGGLWDAAGPDWAFGVGAVTATVALAILVLSPSLRPAGEGN